MDIKLIAYFNLSMPLFETTTTTTTTTTEPVTAIHSSTNITTSNAATAGFSIGLCNCVVAITSTFAMISK